MEGEQDSLSGGKTVSRGEAGRDGEESGEIQNRLAWSELCCSSTILSIRAKLLGLREIVCYSTRLIAVTIN